ncbi:hypothetical protein [Nesterenkonia sp.]|uniref:AMIN-like domain-containing (lipo)protein n=1 Tax=Nesterenkonia sp. TaxID=704201 RepID=UPI002610CBCA|nr:hypothetical protein [Nesterenkonia sp.]
MTVQTHPVPAARRLWAPRAWTAGILLLGLAACGGSPEDEHQQAAVKEIPPLEEPDEDSPSVQQEGESGETTQEDADQGEDPEESDDAAEEVGSPASGSAESTSEDSEEEAARQAAEEAGPSASAGDDQEDSSSAVLDATEFSAEAQESRGFPEMITEFPEDGEELLLEEVRVGHHEGYDRIVFEHTGQGAPGWYAEYVEDAVEPGSGFPLEVHGEAILYVSVVGLVPGNAGAEQGQLEISGPIDHPGTVFRGVLTTFVHHGAASYYIGLDERREYRVSVWEHEEGPRLIIDVLN